VIWDSNKLNNWSKASGMTLLNSGDYYNRIGSYASNGLTEDAKNQIADAKWYLGSTVSYENSSNGLASHWYSYERSTTVYSGNPTSWTGKVGLLYPSDYGYATSGGSTMNRDACLAKELYAWSSYSDCKNNDWLYTGKSQWTITPSSSLSQNAFMVESTGIVRFNAYVYNPLELHPVVYLRSDVKLTGEGTSASPYEVSI